MIYQHCNGKHDLTTVMRRYGGEPGVEEVVRWCRNCGGCVIDMDIDSRTDPGRSMSMMFPRIAEAHVSGVSVAPAPAQPHGIYVECHECADCGHAGINDAHEIDARCGACGWAGPSPKEDRCPECSAENVMGAACPKCSGRYTLVADATAGVPGTQTSEIGSGALAAGVPGTSNDQQGGTDGR